MALDNGIKEQLKQYLAMLESEIVFAASLGTDDASQKVRDFLEEIAEMSERITIEEVTADRTPSFTIMQPGIDSGIAFAGLPLGHEFTSFILALLQVSGGRQRSNKRFKTVSNKSLSLCILRHMLV